MPDPQQQKQCGGSGVDAVDDCLAANHETEPCGCSDCTPVKRYDIGTSFFDGPFPLARESDEGEWVRYDDYRLSSQPEQGGEVECCGKAAETGDCCGEPVPVEPDPQQQKQCGGSGELASHAVKLDPSDFELCDCPGCPDCQDQKGGEGWPEAVLAVRSKAGGRANLFADSVPPHSEEDYETRRYVPATGSPKAEGRQSEVEVFDSVQIAEQKFTEHWVREDDHLNALDEAREFASPKALLERLAGELEERADKKVTRRDEKRSDSSLEGTRTVARFDGEAYGLRDAAQLLRKEAEGLPKSKLEEWCERAKAEGKFDSEYDAFLAAFAHEFSLANGEAEGLEGVQGGGGEESDALQRIAEVANENHGGEDGLRQAVLDAIVDARFAEVEPAPKVVYDFAWQKLHSVLHDRASVECLVDEVLRVAANAEAEGLPGPDAISADEAGQGEADGLGEEADCYSCSEPGSGQCPKSRRPCGHHCNCSWQHDHCHWCDLGFGEQPPATLISSETTTNPGGEDG